jgi:NAD+ synthase
MYARDNGVPVEEVAPAVALTSEQVMRAFQMIDSKREAARYLHEPAALFDPERPA